MKSLCHHSKLWQYYVTCTFLKIIVFRRLIGASPRFIKQCSPQSPKFWAECSRTEQPRNTKVLPRKIPTRALTRTSAHSIPCTCPGTSTEDNEFTIEYSVHDRARAFVRRIFVETYAAKVLFSLTVIITCYINYIILRIVNTTTPSSVHTSLRREKKH